LIGATTENPSFEIISPLLSRCRVFILKSLKEEDIEKIINRTGFKINKKTKDWIINASGGDARQVITLIDNANKLYGKIAIETLKEAMQSVISYDKKGEEHYNTISAYIKSMRAGKTDAALYYLARMIKAGEDPKFIARRMVIFASEDIGMSQPTALVLANEVFRSVEIIGIPECAINLAHGTVYLSECKKDRSSYEAYLKAFSDVDKYGNLSIPMELRNPTTKLNKDIGYGSGYDKYPGKEKSFLPDKIKNKRYYK
jgi:putative ATPase